MIPPMWCQGLVHLQDAVLKSEQTLSSIRACIGHELRFVRLRGRHLEASLLEDCTG